MHLCFCYYFEKAHFVMLGGLVVFFCEVCYTIQLILFKNCAHFFFCVLPNLWFEKLKLSPKSIDVRLVPCLVEWMIS